MVDQLTPITDPATLEALWSQAGIDAEAMIRDTGYVGLRADRLLRRGWPLEAIDWTLDTYHADTANRKAALSLARTLAADPAAFEAATGRAGIGLGGKPGRGKTGLACAVGAALVARGHDVTFVRWGALADDAFAALGRPRSPRADASPRFAADGTPLPESADGLGGVTGPLAAVDVLIIDDLGEAGAGGAQPDLLRRVFREVLWPRYERRAVTLVTTNLAEGELERQFGEAAVSRLAGMLRWCVVDGADERRRVAA